MLSGALVPQRGASAQDDSVGRRWRHTWQGDTFFPLRTACTACRWATPWTEGRSAWSL